MKKHQNTKKEDDTEKIVAGVILAILFCGLLSAFYSMFFSKKTRQSVVIRSSSRKSAPASLQGNKSSLKKSSSGKSRKVKSAPAARLSLGKKSSKKGRVGGFSK